MGFCGQRLWNCSAYWTFAVYCRERLGACPHQVSVLSCREEMVRNFHIYWSHMIVAAKHLLYLEVFLCWVSKVNIRVEKYLLVNILVFFTLKWNCISLVIQWYLSYLSCVGAFVGNVNAGKLQFGEAKFLYEMSKIKC